MKPQNLYKKYPRDSSDAKYSKRELKSSEQARDGAPMVHIVLPGSMFAQSPHLNFLSNNLVMDPRNNRSMLQ